LKAKIDTAQANAKFFCKRTLTEVRAVLKTPQHLQLDIFWNGNAAIPHRIKAVENRLNSGWDTSLLGHATAIPFTQYVTGDFIKE
jgi:hypothetical protein